jgi:hypothetical protein
VALFTAQLSDASYLGRGLFAAHAYFSGLSKFHLVQILKQFKTTFFSDHSWQFKTSFFSDHSKAHNISITEIIIAYYIQIITAYCIQIITAHYIS